MWVYVAAFKAYPGEVKIGRSTNPLKRIQEQVDEHGELLDLAVLRHDTLTDKEFEKALLKAFRKKGWAATSLEKRTRKGWTEFVEAEFKDIVARAEGLGGTVTGHTKDKLSHEGKLPNNSYRINAVEQCLDDLALADSIILTCLLNEVAFPSTYEGFKNFCEEFGELDMLEASSLFHFELASKLKPRYSYGVLA